MERLNYNKDNKRKTIIIMGISTLPSLFNESTDQGAYKAVLNDTDNMAR